MEFLWPIPCWGGHFCMTRQAISRYAKDHLQGPLTMLRRGGAARGPGSLGVPGEIGVIAYRVG